MIKPILVPTGETNSPMVIEMCKKQLSDLDVGQLAYTPRLMHSKEYFDCYDIILIDTKAKIVESEWFVNEQIYNGIAIWQHNGKIAPNSNPRKIISSTNEDLRLPQLSEQSIQLLINYYNEHKCMPESVNVEEYFDIKAPIIEEYEGFIVQAQDERDLESKITKIAFGQVKGFLTTHNCPKRISFNPQGTVDLTIPENEEKLYTAKDMNEFASWYIKNTGRYSNDDLSLKQGEYLKLWLDSKR